MENIYKVDKGIVILLDALGIRNSTIDEAQEFAAFVDRQSSHFEKKIKEYKDGKNLDLFILKDDKFSINTFADTILITIKLTDEELSDEKLMSRLALTEAAIVAALFIMGGFSENFLLRGAISVGEFTQTERVILGPAIADAAAWYEKVSWFGCVFTPNCSRWMNSWSQKNTSLFLSYEDVPIKDDIKIPLWCVNWPVVIARLFTKGGHQIVGKDITPYEWYQHKLRNIKIPVGTETLHHNSDKFFKFSEEKTPHLFVKDKDEDKDKNKDKDAK